MRGMVILMKSIRSYSEMRRLSTFEERFSYLKLDGKVGEETFGYDRYINQILYKSGKWRDQIRNKIIIRDGGCDLGIEGREIHGPVIIHHINPITVEDILNENPMVFDPDNLVCVSPMTHNAIHYSDESILIKDPVSRTRNDTCPWKKG